VQPADRPMAADARGDRESPPRERSRATPGRSGSAPGGSRATPGRGGGRAAAPGERVTPQEEAEARVTRSRGSTLRHRGSARIDMRLSKIGRVVAMAAVV